jgi:two-component system, sensor histidine kinase and response regulator
MPISQTSTLRQTVSAATFQQLQALLQRMVQAIEGALMLTEAEVTHREQFLMAGEVEQFTLVISPQFSALLTGNRPPEAVPLPPASYQPPATYQMDLVFAPEAIASFLNGLIPALAPDAVRRLHRARSLLQPNDAIVQSQFTLQLIAALTPPAPLPVAQVAEAVLQQQIEQERLLNQVTTQIRQSLELPVLLQTAVEQVRQFLQVDRLVIYQLNVDPSDLLAGTGSPAVAAPISGGVITYEARASKAIPSILHLIEDCALLQSPQHRDRYRKGLTLAVADVETKYKPLPCLRQVLQRAQVRAKLVAPIVVQAQLWGLLIAHDCHQPRHWQDSEQQFLRQIGEHLAIAISQAQLYAQVQQQNQTLEQRVIERTQDLRDALLVAQSANRAKSEFLSAMSHELRTPLTCVIGMSSTLLRWSFGDLNQRQRSYLQTIHDSGEHLLQLINDILDLSHLEAGKTVLKLSEFSLSSLTRQTLRTVQDKAMMAGVALDLDLRVDSLHDSFRADPRRVQQILLNLLSNAIKFTPKGGKVTLRVYTDKNVAVLQVKDTGIGISEQERSLLFQKFQQLDASYHRQYEGAGVGLALTKQLVDLHGGSIAVESTVDVGSVFTVRLPRQPLITDAAKRDALNLPDYPSGLIVLIDGQEDSAGLICDILTAAGYQVVWMLDSSTAIGQIEVLEPIAVLTEAQSLHVNGYDMIQHLRRNPTTKHLKVLALTTTPEEQQRCLAIGVDDCLPKPIQPEQLLHRVLVLTGNQEEAPL